MHFCTTAELSPGRSRRRRAVTARPVWGFSTLYTAKKGSTKLPRPTDYKHATEWIEMFLLVSANPFTDSWMEGYIVVSAFIAWQGDYQSDLFVVLTGKHLLHEGRGKTWIYSLVVGHMVNYMTRDIPLTIYLAKNSQYAAESIVLPLVPNDVLFKVHRAPFIRSSSVPGSRALYRRGMLRLRTPSYVWSCVS